MPTVARGWSFAGFIPFGIFAFVHRQTTWDIIGFILACVIWLPLTLTVLIGCYDMIITWVFNGFRMPMS